MIYIGELKGDTAYGLSLIASERNWIDIQDWMEPEQVAWLTFRLRYVEDKPEYFPHGKWATIQRLQGMLETFAENEAKSPTCT